MICFDNMKGNSFYIIHRAAKYLAVWIVAGALVFFSMICSAENAEKTFSISVSNQPLSLVLLELSEISGYSFVYDEDWADLIVTVNIKNLSLYKILRRILNNHNFAIYQENETIRIMLFGDNSGSPADQTIDDAEDSRYVHVGSNAVEPEELLTEEPEEGETDLPSDENVDEDTAIGYGNEHSSNENEGTDAGEKGDRETEMNTEEPETLNADN